MSYKTFEFNCKTCGQLTTKHCNEKTVPKYCSRACLHADPEWHIQRIATRKAHTLADGKPFGWYKKTPFICKTCGTESIGRMRPPGALPQYCSRACMKADADLQAARTNASTLVRRTPESRAKTSAALRLLATLPGAHEKAVERGKRAKPKEWHEKLCECGCGETIRYSTSKWDKKPPPTYLPTHIYRTAAYRENQSATMKKIAEDPLWRERKRADMLKAYENLAYPQSNSRPTLQVAAMLTAMQIAYVQEWTFGHYSFDFYLPDYHKVIEVNGDYWHANPILYPDGPINKIQANRLRVDASKASYLTHRNIPLLILWEHDLKHSKNECSEKLAAFTHQVSSSSK